MNRRTWLKAVSGLVALLGLPLAAQAKPKRLLPTAADLLKQPYRCVPGGKQILIADNQILRFESPVTLDRGSHVTNCVIFGGQSRAGLAFGRGLRPAMITIPNAREIVFSGNFIVNS